MSLKISPNEPYHLLKIRLSFSVKLSKNLNLVGHTFCLHDLQLLKVFSHLFHAQAHSWIYFSPKVTDCRLLYILFAMSVLSPFHDEMNCE